MKKYGRKDTNQREIVQALQQLGAEVFDCSSVGCGFPDLAVQFRGQVHLIEVKTRRGRLTADQVAFHRRWRVAIVRSVDEAMRAVGGDAMRGDFDEDEDPDFEPDDGCCDECDGDGWILTCCDDICNGLGYCIHGDGMEMCACNTSAEPPSNAPLGWRWTPRKSG